jgi:hypothetical protein
VGGGRAGGTPGGRRRRQRHAAAAVALLLLPATPLDRRPQSACPLQSHGRGGGQWSFSVVSCNGASVRRPRRQPVSQPPIDLVFLPLLSSPCLFSPFQHAAGAQSLPAALWRRTACCMAPSDGRALPPPLLSA